MAMCQDCGNDEADGALCEPCRLDRVLNDMMKLSTHQLAQVVAEGLAYPGVAARHRILDQIKAGQTPP